MHCNFACVALQCSLCLRIVIAPLSGASLVNFMLVFKLVGLCIHVELEFLNLQLGFLYFQSLLFRLDSSFLSLRVRLVCFHRHRGRSKQRGEHGR